MMLTLRGGLGLKVKRIVERVKKKGKGRKPYILLIKGEPNEEYKVLRIEDDKYVIGRAIRSTRGFLIGYNKGYKTYNTYREAELARLAAIKEVGETLDYVIIDYLYLNRYEFLCQLTDEQLLDSFI